MHPLFTRGRFGLYLVAWIPLAAILTYLIASGGRMGWLESAVVVIPLCVVYAFICLSAWYTAKSAPIERETALRLTLGHSAAAALISAMWVILAWGLVTLLSKTTTFQGLDLRFTSQSRILFGAGFLLYLLAIAYHYVILSMKTSREAEARAMETSVLARDAELKALKAQVNPHFLFNSLNSISALTSVDPARARDMCVLLGDFLRLTLGLGEKALVPLREELELLQRFLAIEKVRFGERLHVDTRVAMQAQSCLLPPLLLQPLVENAIIHGIATQTAGGTVRLTAECSGGRLHLSVENSVDPDAAPSRKGGLGLANVRQRLETRYGKEAALRTTAEEEFFRVTISIPAEMPEAPAQSAEGEVAPAKEARL